MSCWRTLLIVGLVFPACSEPGEEDPAIVLDAVSEPGEGDPSTPGYEGGGGFPGASCKTFLDCDDGNECTVDACEDGLCVAEVAPGSDCDDGDPCTEDFLHITYRVLWHLNQTGHCNFIKFLRITCYLLKILLLSANKITAMTRN